MSRVGLQEGSRRATTDLPASRETKSEDLSKVDMTSSPSDRDAAMQEIKKPTARKTDTSEKKEQYQPESDLNKFITAYEDKREKTINPVGGGYGPSYPVTVKEFNKEQMLDALNAISDKDKGAFIRYAATHNCVIPQMVGQVFKDGKVDIERGQRALHGFDAERQAKLIYDSSSGWGNLWAEQAEILAAVTKLDPSQTKELGQALYKLAVSGADRLSQEELDSKSGAFLKQTLDTNLTGLNKIIGLKAIDACTTRDAAEFLKAASPEKLNIEEVQKVLANFSPSDRQGINDIYRNIDPKGRSLTDIFATQNSDPKPVAAFVRSLEQENPALSCALDLFLAKGNGAEFLKILEAKTSTELVAAQDVYNKYFPTTLKSVIEKSPLSVSERVKASRLLSGEIETKPEDSNPFEPVTPSAAVKEVAPSPSPAPAPTPTPTSPASAPSPTTAPSVVPAKVAPPAKAAPIAPASALSSTTVPEAAGKYTVKYTDFDRKHAVFDEKRMIDLVSSRLNKEVRDFAKNSGYDAGWEKQIARLVVEEALSKKDLSSEKVSLSYSDMKAAGDVVWKKMQDQRYDKLLMEPEVKNIHADKAKVITSVKSTSSPQPEVKTIATSVGELNVDSAHKEHLFFREFISAIETRDTTKIDTFIEKMSAYEKIKMAANISPWLADQDINAKQEYLIKKALGYLNHKAINPGTSPEGLFNSQSEEGKKAITELGTTIYKATAPIYKAIAPFVENFRNSQQK